LEGIYGIPLYKVFGGQHRYFWFYDKKCIKNLIVPILPYPKQVDLKNHLDIKVKYKDDGDNWDDFINLLNKPVQKKVSKQEEKLNQFFG